MKMSSFDSLAKIFESRSIVVPVPARYEAYRGDEFVARRQAGKRVAPPQQLKGGLVDRSLLSWARIIGATALWWAALEQASRNLSTVLHYLKSL